MLERETDPVATASVQSKDLTSPSSLFAAGEAPSPSQPPVTVDSSHQTRPDEPPPHNDPPTISPTKSDIYDLIDTNESDEDLSGAPEPVPPTHLQAITEEPITASPINTNSIMNFETLDNQFQQSTQHIFHPPPPQLQPLQLQQSIFEPPPMDEISEAIIASASNTPLIPTPAVQLTPRMGNILPPIAAPFSQTQFSSYLGQESITYLSDDASPPLNPVTQPVSLLSEQDQKNCMNLIKIVKKHPSAWPFLVPVDPVKAGAPTYFDVVKNPMDFGTIEKRLSLVYYTSVEMVLADVQLVLDNCYLFNPPTNSVHTLATHIDKLLETRIPKIWPTLRWRSGAQEDEFQENPFTESQWKDAKFLIKTLKLHNSAYPFLKPVDYIALNIPLYPTIVKTPMDFGTIGQRVDARSYTSVKAFMSDLQLVFDNCYLFNSPDHAVSLAARQVEKYLENQLFKLWPMVKWRGGSVVGLGSGSGRAAAAAATVAFKAEASFVAPVEEPLKQKRRRNSSGAGAGSSSGRRTSVDPESADYVPRGTFKKITLKSSAFKSAGTKNYTDPPFAPQEPERKRSSSSSSSSAKANDLSSSLALLQQQMAMLKEGKRKKQKKEESTMRTTQLLASGIASTIAGLVANVKRKHSDDESSSSDSDSSSSSDSDSDSESESEVIKMKQLLASFHSIQSQTQAGGSIQNAAPAQPKRISYAPPPKSCEFCEVTSTSTWRRGPSGVGTLCNKCGVRWAKNNRHYFPNSTVGSSSSVPKKKKQKASTEVGVIPVTYEQKVRLSSMIESLSEQHQASVFEMIRSAIPVSNEGEEIELDIEAIDDDSLRKLYDHVEKCVAEDQKVEAERQKAAQRVIEELQRNRGE